jgi:hypothetical protein
VAWAGPGQSQAVSGGFDSAQDFRRPKPPQAKPKPGLLGQAGPEHHYSSILRLTDVLFIFESSTRHTSSFKLHLAYIGTPNAACKINHRIPESLARFQDFKIDLAPVGNSIPTLPGLGFGRFAAVRIFYLKMLINFDPFLSGRGYQASG